MQIELDKVGSILLAGNGWTGVTGLWLATELDVKSSKASPPKIPAAFLAGEMDGKAIFVAMSAVQALRYK